MRKPALAVIWIIATSVTTAIAYVAVNAAGAEVTDRPLTSVVAPDNDASSTTSTTAGIPTSAAVGSNTSTTDNVTAPSAPAATAATPSTSTLSVPATTTSAGPWQQATIPSEGGLVIVSYRPGEVRLESVAPSPGFGYEIDDQGPSEVRVEFDGGELRVEIRARWDNGLVTEINENR
jgi:hypothetical protein